MTSVNTTTVTARVSLACAKEIAKAAKRAKKPIGSYLRELLETSHPPKA